MKKSNKRISMAVAGAVTVLGIIQIGVEVYSYATLLHEKTVEKLIYEVWEENKEEITKTLNLKRTPTLKLEYDRTDSAIMYVQTLFTTRGHFFNKVIEKAETDYIVHVCVPTLVRQANMTLKKSLRKRKEASKGILKFLFCHELRHIWQAENGFMVGRLYEEMDLSFINGHGEKVQERDANSFAETMADDVFERKLFTLLTVNQNVGTKLALSKDDIELLKEAEAEYCACL